MATKAQLRDRTVLLLAGIVGSVLVWVFWHYLGGQAYAILLVIVLGELILDNRRLRKKVARLEASMPPSSQSSEEGRPALPDDGNGRER
jgi:uncharacterized membrane protein SirB2